MFQLKFSLKICNNILIGGGPSKKRSLTEKNQSSYADFARSCRNYAGNRKIRITSILVLLCFIQN